MPFSVRRLAAVAVLVAMFVSLASSVAMAASGTISEADCVQGTIKDRSTGQPISRTRCESLIGRNVQLANTGFDMRPVIAAGVLCLVGAAAFGMRRRSAQGLS
jgi:LPXTG-motif cell wall-anchored protein